MLNQSAIHWPDYSFNYGLRPMHLPDLCKDIRIFSSEKGVKAVVPLDEHRTRYIHRLDTMTGRLRVDVYHQRAFHCLIWLPYELLDIPKEQTVPKEPNNIAFMHIKYRLTLPDDWQQKLETAIIAGMDATIA